MHKIQLNVLGLSVSQTQSGAYALVLAEENGDRRIPIIIGPVEAQSIAIQLEGLKPPRPLTHDLFKNISQAFQIELVEVIIYKLEEGIFFSELICEMNSNRVAIDARTSDAVALALRFQCSIFTSEEILQKAGIVIEMTEAPEEDIADFIRDESVKEEGFDVFSIDELNDMLQKAIADEQYEKAADIKSEISKRQEKGN